MPRSRASLRSLTDLSSSTSPHQPVETVQTPKPTSETAISVSPSVRYFMFRSLFLFGPWISFQRLTTFYRLTLSTFSQSKPLAISFVFADRCIIARCLQVLWISRCDRALCGRGERGAGGGSLRFYRGRGRRLQGEHDDLGPRLEGREGRAGRVRRRGCVS